LASGFALTIKNPRKVEKPRSLQMSSRRLRDERSAVATDGLERVQMAKNRERGIGNFACFTGKIAIQSADGVCQAVVYCPRTGPETDLLHIF
jgi:hypothetical protein